MFVIKVEGKKVQLLKENIDITLRDGTNIRMQGSQFQKMIDSLPRSERRAAANNLVQTLTQRMEHGQALINAVNNGNLQPPPGIQEVSDITLYLYGRASSQNDNFSNFPVLLTTTFQVLLSTRQT